MSNSAQRENPQVLITDVSSYLGENLAQNFLKANISVYGAGKGHPAQELLEDQHFTYLDIDLSQQLPQHLPGFDLIIHLTAEDSTNFSANKLSQVSLNIISYAKSGVSKVIFVTRMSTNTDLSDFFTESQFKNHLKLFLIGDIYGPGMKLQSKYHVHSDSYTNPNPLADLISQATTSDKIILDKEGLTILYPTYIDDAIRAFNKYLFEKNPRDIYFIVSNDPTTSLSAAYKIQHAMRILAGKELNLFFSGNETFQKPQPEPALRVHDLPFGPKFSLEDGLEKTIGYFQEKGLIKESTSIVSKVPSDPQLDINQKPYQTKIEKKHKKLAFKFPAINLKAKSTLAAFLIILTLFIAKGGLDVYLATNSIKSARAKLETGDFESAKKYAQNAQNQFHSAQSEFNFLLSPIKLVAPGKIGAIESGILSAETGSTAAVNFINGAEGLAQNLKSITNKDEKTAPNLETAQSMFEQAYYQSAYATSLAHKASKGPIFKTKFAQLESNFSNLSNLSLSAKELTSLIPALVNDKPKNYLILIQNNMELRPGGGFIGNIAQIAFEGGKLKDVAVEDIYQIDGQLKEKISPPAPLVEKLGVDKLYLRDTNWSTDFAINAQIARDFYKKETGKTVDGTIAIDLAFVQKLLEKMGPVKLDDYNEEINATNLFEKGEYYSEVGFFPGSTQKKDFFASLTRTLISKLTESLNQNSTSAKSPLLALVTTAGDALAQKHMQLSFDEPSLASFVKSKGWDNELPPFAFNPTDDSKGTRDFLAIAEANVGANKVNRYLERNIAYEMTVDRDAGLFATLTVSYKNTSPADTWPAGTYVNYMRVFVPLNSSLESYEIDGQQIDLKTTTTKLKKGEMPPPVVSTQGNLTVFENYIEVPVKKTKTVTFKYRIPKNIKLETTPAYSLYISKQPGTEKDPIKFTFNLPAYLKINSVSPSCHPELDSGSNCSDSSGKQNYSTTTNLETDKTWEIKISKK